MWSKLILLNSTGSCANYARKTKGYDRWRLRACGRKSIWKHQLAGIWLTLRMRLAIPRGNMAAASSTATACYWTQMTCSFWWRTNLWHMQVGGTIDSAINTEAAQTKSCWVYASPGMPCSSLFVLNSWTRDGAILSLLFPCVNCYRMCFAFCLFKVMLFDWEPLCCV